MFFEPRTQSSIQHRRLRYLLLLSLRMALLVLLALAFANPFVMRPGGAHVGRHDSSCWSSTTRSACAPGSRMNDAKREALSVLASRQSVGARCR